MSRLVLSATLALALLAAFVEPAPAAACTTTTRPHSVIVYGAPANGVVQIAIFCASSPCFAGDLPDPLPVQDMLSGEEIPGEVVHVSHRNRSSQVLWLPDAPLVAERGYELMWRPEPSHPGPFEATH